MAQGWERGWSASPKRQHCLCSEGSAHKKMFTYLLVTITLKSKWPHPLSHSSVAPEAPG